MAIQACGQFVGKSTWDWRVRCDCAAELKIEDAEEASRVSEVRRILLSICHRWGWQFVDKRWRCPACSLELSQGKIA